MPVIGLKISRHLLNQSDAKQKPIAFSRARSPLPVFSLSSHWLLEKFTFVLIGCCDYFGFDFTTLNVEALNLFVLIFSFPNSTGGTDEAICYAETASSPEDRKFANHLININGDEVLNKRKVYERSRTNAWSNEDSILKLATAIMKESAEMKTRFGIDAIEVSRLVCIHLTLTFRI